MNRHLLRCALGVLVAGAALAWLLLPRGPIGDAGPSHVSAAEAKAGDGLGHAAAFGAELQAIGQLSPRSFADRYGGKTKYLPTLTWDPTKAEYFDRLNLDPNKPGEKVRVRGVEARKMRERARRDGRPIPEGQEVTIDLRGGYDFRLDAKELAAFKANGFVVSERMGAPSCTELFYRIYKRDLPVIVTTDAILHAWHRSFDAILEEVEVAMLVPTLDDILAAMAAQVRDAKTAYGTGFHADNLADADYFLAVARSLLAGKLVPTVLDQGGRLGRTLAACDGERMEKVTLFDRERVVDFSQFKPRGRYEESLPQQRYFRAMTWLGRIDLRVAGDPELATPRQLAGAVALHDLLRRSGRFEKWRQFDRVLRAFVGQADSMTFAQLGAVLDLAGVRSPAGLATEAALADLQRQILAGKVGAQEIRGDVFFSDPWSSEKVILPRSFAFLGQRFAVDSWATSQVVYDEILRDGEKVQRRIPSALDVAFAVLGNDHVVPALHARMVDTDGRRFRDGLNYQHNLAAVRAVVDAQREATWSDSLYAGWLGCLRELSKPTTDAKYPEAMRKPAWAMKALNTQLASWTQLRHDTILYVKQSYTSSDSCHYPAGFVEPVPHFWARLSRMATGAATLIEQAPYPNPAIRDKQAKFLRAFAAAMATLRGIAEKELAREELSKEATKFLENVVEMNPAGNRSGQPRTYDGWYQGLFYKGRVDSVSWDALVADVHTDPPDPVAGDPGCVLHQGVGSVDLLVVAIDNGKDRMVYLGPVLSHYEFEVPGVRRKTDGEWKLDLREGRVPPRPSWTRSYLVPGVNKDVKGYGME